MSTSEDDEDAEAELAGFPSQPDSDSPCIIFFDSLLDPPRNRATEFLASMADNIRRYVIFSNFRFSTVMLISDHSPLPPFVFSCISTWLSLAGIDVIVDHTTLPHVVCRVSAFVVSYQLIAALQ
jgi:hypothetical protein